MFSQRFQVIWWVALLVVCTIAVVAQFVIPNWPANEGGSSYRQYVAFVPYAVFVVWIVLLLMPLFSEISVFGIGGKRELHALQKEVKRQAATDRLYWLGNDLASLRFLALLSTGSDEARRLIPWQGKQALDHARACKLPHHLIDRLDTILQAVPSGPELDATGNFAEQVLQLQKEVAGHFVKEDSD